MHDFIYNVWFFTMDMLGMGEKTPKNIYTQSVYSAIPTDWTLKIICIR